MIATRDLDQTVDDLHEVLGTRPVEGGAHIGRGTRNYLVGLGDTCYLEVIAVDEAQPEPDQPRLFGLDKAFGPSRLVTWAVTADDFEAARTRADAAGAPLGEVGELRRAAAGGEVRVRLTERPDVLEDGVVPFLVDWGTTDHPAPNLPRVDLVGLRLSHPQPARIRRLLVALGVRPALVWGVTPALEVVVQGTHGLVALR
ncbi:VOC family protein [Nocardioides bigeumensis]|uniref:VOC family protein n=1 Tax=Nocardioides bigeumensis TaxID=433657 RepID=UPI0031E4335D